MSRAPVTVIGNHLSPYVRKVLAVLEHKGIAYQMDPIVPFHGNAAFEAVSPLRRIPVLIDGPVTLCDSTVIAEYLEDLQPEPRLLPVSAADRAHARWLDEFADTRLADVLIWKIFGPVVVAPAIFGKPRDLDAVARVMANDLPPVMDYLEGVAPQTGFVHGAVGLADISVATHFTNLRWSRQAVDAARWPKAAAWIERTLAANPLARVTAAADRVLRLPPAAHREVLPTLGIAVTSVTMGGSAAKVGPMTVI